MSLDKVLPMLGLTGVVAPYGVIITASVFFVGALHEAPAARNDFVATYGRRAVIAPSSVTAFSGRATSCPRCGIRFPGPLGHGNRAAAWLCPRFIRRTPRALAPQAARTSQCVAGAGGASAVGPPRGRLGGLLFWLKYVVLLCEKCIYSLRRRGMKFFQVFVAFAVKYDILTMYRSVRKFAAPVHGFPQGGHPTIAVFTT